MAEARAWLEIMRMVMAANSTMLMTMTPARGVSPRLQ